MRPGKITVERDLELLQQQSFSYFVHETNPDNGLVVDKTEENCPASIAATGMALAAYPVAVERGYITRDLAIRLTLAALRFFRDSPQGPEPDATGYKGFYYHFLDMKSGRRAWKCELSTIDTSLLLAGALTSLAYFDRETSDEKEIRDTADGLYRRVDWQWALDGTETVTQGWTPEDGFYAYHWQGYDEGMLLYILGLGSPTHPLPESCFRGWSASYWWRNCFDVDYLYAGPLFTHQLSHIWIDVRGVQDEFMRNKGIDYFENSRRATLVQQRYAIENDHKFNGYSENCWGVTASDGPGPATRNVNGIDRTFYEYVGRGVPDGPDDGTLAPWVVAASLPFAPNIVLPSLDYYINKVKLTELNPYGFKATFNPTFPTNPVSAYGWISPWHYGIDQGPVVLMTENYRSGMLWELMRKCPYAIDGLRRADFQGGWLPTKTAETGENWEPRPPRIRSLLD